MHVSYTVFDINDEFGRKLQTLLYLCVFNIPLMGFALEFCNNSGAPTRSSNKCDNMCICLDTISCHRTDRQRVRQRERQTEMIKHYCGLYASAC